MSAIGGMIAIKVLDKLLPRVLDRIADSPNLSLKREDIPAVRELLVEEASKVAVEPEMTGMKKPTKSLTILAGLFMIASGVGMAGLNIDFQTGEFSGNIYVLWGSLTSFFAGAAAVWGRWRASSKIG